MVDDRSVWRLWCVRVQAGGRGGGISRSLIDGAARFAAENGAPVVEAYPVDGAGEEVDLRMAFVGLRSWFERAAFTKASDTTSALDGFPRVLMRCDLR